MSAHPLSKDQRRRLIKYLKGSKPDAWRNLISVVNQGPSWKALGLYYECVRAGTIEDEAFMKRWQTSGHMTRLPEAAIHSQAAFYDFLASLRQKRLASAAEDKPQEFERNDISSKVPDDLKPANRVPKVPDDLKTANRVTSKENKKTISLMIEPSLYEKVKLIAGIEERSIGAQIRHALKQHVQSKPQLFDDHE